MERMDFIVGYHDHDSLLKNRDEDEKMRAWKDYQTKWDGSRPSTFGGLNTIVSSSGG